MLHLPNLIVSNPILALSWKAGLENISKGDGVTISIIGMSVVFSGLIVLNFVLILLGKVEDFIKKIPEFFKNLTKSKEKVEELPVKAEPKQMTGEEAAAICMALIIYQRIHQDEANQRITFDSALRPLSPWGLSAKVQNLERANPASGLKQGIPSQRKSNFFKPSGPGKLSIKS